MILPALWENMLLRTGLHRETIFIIIFILKIIITITSDS